MANSIIGTAGHVDHGKTCLIKALTGIQTDRLKEEKKRGITIDLGFAHLDMPDGTQAGIIDVPGHEKFVRNMLAGASGIDLVLLVIAADEGIMPQTKEHLDILSLLNVKKGIVAVTKIDMVEEEWLSFMEEEIKKGLEGTFLENADMCFVSSYTGEGIDNLRQKLFDMLLQQKNDKDEQAFRLPIDRVFSVEGIGTVITGTTVEGTLNIGDNLTIYPSEISTKARNIQVHSKDVSTACSGQRTAINLAGIKKTDISRGDVLALQDSMAVTKMLDAKISVLKDSKRSIKNNSTVHFYHGSNELLCKVVLLDKNIIQPGEWGYAQLKFDEDVAIKAEDYFVLRFFSPLETVGGGVILDTNPKKRKRNIQETLDVMEIKCNGTLIQKVSSVIADYGSFPCSPQEISLHINVSLAKLAPILEKLLNKKEIIQVADNLYIHISEIAKLKQAATTLLEKFHQENPLKQGLKREELRTRLRPNIPIQYVDRQLNLLINQKVLKENNGIISSYIFQIKINEDTQKISQEILQMYQDAEFAPPTTQEVIEKYKKSDAKNLLSKLITDGKLIRLTDQIYMSDTSVQKAYNIIKKLYDEKGEIILGDARDAFATSRKFALALLEYFDNKKITKKIGDSRKIV